MAKKDANRRTPAFLSIDPFSPRPAFNIIKPNCSFSVKVWRAVNEEGKGGGESKSGGPLSLNSSSQPATQQASRSSSSSFFDRSLHPFKGEGEKEEEEWSRQTYGGGGTDWGGREKMMTKPVFASFLLSFHKGQGRAARPISQTIAAHSAEERRRGNNARTVAWSGRSG